MKQSYSRPLMFDIGKTEYKGCRIFRDISNSPVFRFVKSDIVSYICYIERMAPKLKDILNRKASKSDVSPGGDFTPLNEEFKPNSTRARFEELANTYRNTKDEHGRALRALDSATVRHTSMLHLLSRLREGEIPTTEQFVDTFHKVDYDKMREYATTFQGKKIIDNLETSSNAGIKAFEEINQDDSAQKIVKHLNDARIKSLDDRKAMTKRAKEGSGETKDMAGTAGKDLFGLARGIGTSSTFRTALSDFASLVGAVLQNKDLEEEGEGAPHMIDRVRDLVVEVRGNRGVRDSLASMSSLYTTVYGRSTSALKDAKSKTKGHEAYDDLSAAGEEAKGMFGRLGNGYDTTAMLVALSAIGAKYRDNEDFSNLFGDVKEFGSWAMDADDELLTSDEFESRGKDLIDKARQTMTEQDTDQFKTLSRESNEYMKAVQANPVLADYRDSMMGLMHSVVGTSDMDGEERQEHYRALRQDMIANLPLLMQSIRYAPLPRVSGQNDQMEFAADNIVLDLKRFIPDHISFDSHTEMYPRSAMLKEKRAKQSGHGFKGEQFFSMTITGIHCTAKNVAFYFKKKKGMPRVAEKGIADMIVGGRGMDILIRLRRLHDSERSRVPLAKDSVEDEHVDSKKSKSKSKHTKHSKQSAKKKAKEATMDGDEDKKKPRMRSLRQFDIADVRVKMHDLDIRVRENKHNIGSTLGIGMMRPAAKKLIAKQLSQHMMDYLVQGDLLYSKYGGSAKGLVLDQGHKAIGSVKTAARKGGVKGKEQMNKIKERRNKGNKVAEEDMKDKVTPVEDTAAAAADKIPPSAGPADLTDAAVPDKMVKDTKAKETAEDMMARKRHDSLVDNPNNTAAPPEVETHY